MLADLAIEELLVEVARQGESRQHEEGRGGGHDRCHQPRQADAGESRVGMLHEADDHGPIGRFDPGLNDLHGAGGQKYQQLHGRGEEDAL